MTFMSPDSYFDPDPRHDLSKNQYLNFDSPRYTPPTGTLYTVLPDTLTSPRAVQGLLSSLIKLLLVSLGSAVSPDHLMITKKVTSR